MPKSRKVKFILIFLSISILLLMSYSILVENRKKWAKENCAIEENWIENSTLSDFDIKVENEVCSDFIHTNTVSIFLKPKKSSIAPDLIFKYEQSSLSKDAIIEWKDKKHLNIEVNQANQILFKKESVNNIIISIHVNKIMKNE